MNVLLSIGVTDDSATLWQHRSLYSFGISGLWKRTLCSGGSQSACISSLIFWFNVSCYLQALLEFLCKVVSREKRNKMNLWAVATIMAPNLFLHKAVPSRLTEGTEKGQAEKAAGVMRLLIRYQDLLWMVGHVQLQENEASFLFL